MQLATAHAEKLRVSRYFLILFAVFGVIAAIMDYPAGNYTVATAGVSVAALCPLFSICRAQSVMPTYRDISPCSSWCSCSSPAPSTSSIAAPTSCGYRFFSFGYFYLAGIRVGGMLSAASFMTLIAAYIAYPWLHTETRVPLETFLQVMSAFGFTSLFAYLYEHGRDRQEQLLPQQAEYDFLTGIPNRRGLMQFMEAQLYLGARKNRPFSLVLVDLDDFKNVNDIHGHDVGDEVLKAFAKRLQDQLRRSDRLGRWGGEEFALVLPDETLSGAVPVAEKLRQHLAASSFARLGRITASFGVTEYIPGENLDALIKRADTALYRAKHGGKNRAEAEPGPNTSRSSLAAN